MSYLMLIILLALIFSKPKDQRNSEASKRTILTVIGAFFLLGLAGGLLSWLPGLIFLAACGGIGYWCYLQIRSRMKAQQRRREYGWDPQNWDRRQSNARTRTEWERQQKTQTGSDEKWYSAHSSGSRMTAEASTLPKRAAKRKRIVENCNERYDLYLTPEQIQSIVNSSYMSQVWQDELSAMDRKYETVYEWFQGPTSWLRVYMYAFHVQEITSDLQQQEDIGMYAFQSVFSYSDSLGKLSMSERIKAVNNRFFTSFDDVSFMIAYRFLEQKGLCHSLDGGDIPVNGDPVDDLVRRYQ